MHRVWEILLAAFPSSPEEAQQRMTYLGAKGKGLSDFVNIVVSMTFTMAFCIFSFDQFAKQPSGLAAAGYINVCLWSGVLALYFSILLNQMIFLYLFQDVRTKWSLWFKIPLGIFSMLSYVSLGTGIWNVAVALAKLGKCG